MSLVNQMLRDLDARQAEGDGPALAESTKALPVRQAFQHTSMMRRGLGVGVALMLVIGVFWQISSPLDFVALPRPGLSKPVAPTITSGVSAVAPPLPVAGPVNSVSSSAIPGPAPAEATPPMAVPTQPQPPRAHLAPAPVAPVPLPASTRVVPAGASHAIQLKLDELLTFNVRARMGEKEAAAGGGVSLDGFAERPVPAAKGGRPENADKLEKPATNDASPRIEKIERHDPGAEFYRNGIDAMRQGRLKDAVEQLQFALRDNPRMAMARQALLGVYVDQRDWDEAQTLLKEGLALMPDQSAWAMALARIQVERGQTAQAWETLQKYEGVAGRNADYQGFAGVLLQHMKKPHEAVERYRAALKLRPREGRWWYALGTALEEDGKATEALEIYRRALALGGLTPSMAESVEKKLR